jgi:hypothetical protein
MCATIGASGTITAPKTRRGGGALGTKSPLSNTMIAAIILADALGS